MWRCDFCGTSQSKAERLFRERGAIICADCVELCHELLLEGRAEKAEKTAAKRGPLRAA